MLQYTKKSMSIRIGGLDKSQKHRLRVYPAVYAEILFKEVMAMRTFQQHLTGRQYANQPIDGTRMKYTQHVFIAGARYYPLPSPRTERDFPLKKQCRFACPSVTVV